MSQKGHQGQRWHRGTSQVSGTYSACRLWPVRSAERFVSQALGTALLWVCSPHTQQMDPVLVRGCTVYTYAFTQTHPNSRIRTSWSAICYQYPSVPSASSSPSSLPPTLFLRGCILVWEDRITSAVRWPGFSSATMRKTLDMSLCALFFPGYKTDHTHILG